MSKERRIIRSNNGDVSSAYPGMIPLGELLATKKRIKEEKNSTPSPGKTGRKPGKQI